MNLINRLEIADGSKQLLLSKDFAFKSLLNISASDLVSLAPFDSCQNADASWKVAFENINNSNHQQQIIPIQSSFYPRLLAVANSAVRVVAATECPGRYG